MAPPLLRLSGISLSFGGEALLEGAEMALEAGERLCLVGRNGSGKSTLLKIAAGLVEPDGGERFLQPGCKVQYLEQEPDLGGFDSLLEYAASSLEEDEGDYRAAFLLESLGLDGERHPKGLSGGEMRRAALVRALAPEPDILLLDEPTNHLDITAIEWLEKELAGMKSAIALISHDRRLLQRLSRKVLWLDRGQTRLLARGFEHFEDWRAELLEREQEERHKLSRQIVREEHWLRYGVTARRKRNQRRLGELFALRDEKKRLAGRQIRHFNRQKLGGLAEGERSGKLVIEAEGISKSYDGRRLIDSLSLKINRRDRLAIVGPNGAGKTTLINILTGALEPDEGRVRLGVKLEIARFDQRRESLDPSLSLADVLSGGRGDQIMVRGQPRHVIGYMKDFLFLPEQARTPVKLLSGGERGRLMLALAMARPSNLLVLDEPTNDLDMETLDLLEELVADYEGTVLLVSHDRDFIDRTASAVLLAGENGQWRLYAGGYSDMEAQRREERSGDRQKGRGKKGRSGRGGQSGREEEAKGSPRQAKPSRPSRPSRTRLSYKDKYALEQLPGQIAELEQNISQLQERLNDPGFHARDPQAFNQTINQLATAQKNLEKLEDKWLHLEMLREELEG